MPPARRVLILAVDGAQSLDVMGPAEALAAAGAYRVDVVAPGDGAVRLSNGLELRASPLPDPPPRVDTLLVAGGPGTRAAVDDAPLVAWVARAAGRARRTASVCTGAFLLAEAGLLSGRRATTHWRYCDALARRHPDIALDSDAVYVRDGEIWTSAGVTAGIDLALALVEDDHDARTAQTVARWLVMFLRRPGGQTQFAAGVWNARATVEPIRRAQDAIELEPGGDHHVARLAGRVGMSERHFIRRFTQHTGTTPARYVSAVRLDAARRALEESTDTVDAIAQRCGFGTAETMRRTFARDLGVTPDAYRHRFTVATPRHDERR